MSSSSEFLVQGPFPLDLVAVAASVRPVLERAAEDSQEGRVSGLRPLGGAAMEPGLYLLWRGEAQPAIAGFWLVFGSSYLDLGPQGPPDREPPFARAILGAATEEVWWQTLRVWPLESGTWRPVIVLEWPPELANRSAAPPPGLPPVASAARAGRAAEERAAGRGWLEEAAPVVVEEHPAHTPAVQIHADLPRSRSRMALVAGELSFNRRTHKGRFGLVVPAALPRTDGAPLDPETWITRARLDAPSATPDPGSQALALGGGRVGFPLAGWLTRSLALWPASAAELQPGTLLPRDVGRRWRGQVFRVVASTVAVLVGVLYLAGAVQLAAQPRPRAAAQASQPDAQPAMSVCSADHQRFVEELRCQIQHFASGGSPDDLACGDPGSTPGPPGPDDDLQAAWCGLRDRDLDGWKVGAKGVSYADLAATRACFNVLGYPYSYEAPRDPAAPDRREVDPDRFLRDRDLGLAALSGLVSDLDASCAIYRRRVSSQIEGAVLATLVGAPEGSPPVAGAAGEPGRLRGLLVDRATDGISREEQGCFRDGTVHGVDSPRIYSELCAGPDATDEAQGRNKAWAVLGGHGPADASSVIGRYTAARFGSAGQAPPASGRAPLWQCHLDLSSGARTGVGAVPTRWDLSAPVPSHYEVRLGQVRSQLVMDAALRAIADGTDAGPCWQVLSHDLSRYAPVHPLLGPETAAAWPSSEQQLCGQICAARYHVRTGPGAESWVTPGTDLALCTDPDAPAAEPELGRGVLDRLSLPWNAAKHGDWTPPDPAEICAFHLVAQGYLPTGDGGVLLGKVAPPVWAGSTAAGSGLAGGADGAAASAARSLSTYGRTRSDATCGYVATQCLVSGMLEITADATLEPHQWSERWQRWVAAVGSGSAVPAPSPWCGLILPYIRTDGVLPEGQMDYPCAKGVSDTLAGVTAALNELANGAHAEVKR